MDMSRATKAMRKMRVLLSVSLVALACGHVGLDFNDNDVRLGDGDTTGDGDPNGDGDATTNGDGDATTSGDGDAAGGTGAQGTTGGASGSGGMVSMGCEALPGGYGGGGGADDGSEEDFDVYLPSCECAPADDSFDHCSIACLTSPCRPTCSASCDIRPVHDGSTNKVELECGSEATCRVRIERIDSAPNDIEVFCRGPGDCLIQCGAAGACKTYCEGSGLCRADCGEAHSCFLSCGANATCGLARGTPLDMNCPSGQASACENGLIVCDLAWCDDFEEY